MAHPALHRAGPPAHPEVRAHLDDARRELDALGGRMVPGPVDLTGLTWAEQERILDERRKAFRAYNGAGGAYGRWSAKAWRGQYQLREKLGTLQAFEEDTAGVEAPPAYARPTLAQFVTHARKFGPECVRETARCYLDDLELRELKLELAGLGGGRDGKPTSRPRRQRRTSADLVDQVRALDDRGMVRTAIADVLNISDRRVTEILRKARPSENGGQKRLVPAKNFAAKPKVRPSGQPGGLAAQNGSVRVDGQLTVYDVVEGAPAA